MTLTTSVHGVEVDVAYTYCQPYRAPRDRFGFRLEPDEPAEIIIDSVTTRHGDDITDIVYEHPRIWPDLLLECMEHYRGFSPIKMSKAHPVLFSDMEAA